MIGEELEEVERSFRDSEVDEVELLRVLYTVLILTRQEVASEDVSHHGHHIQCR